MTLHERICSTLLIAHMENKAVDSMANDVLIDLRELLLNVPTLAQDGATSPDAKAFQRDALYLLGDKKRARDMTCDEVMELDEVQSRMFEKARSKTK